MHMTIGFGLRPSMRWLHIACIFLSALWLNSSLAAPGSVGRYTSSPWGFSTNSFWVEGHDGVVLIDVQFLPSAALAAKRAAETATGKPVVAAFVLHANPDKFNGTEVLQAAGVRVYTTRAIADAIGSVHAMRKAWFFDDYQPDYPDRTPSPEVLDEGLTRISIAGIDFDLYRMGPGVSKAHLVVAHERDVFVGDLLADGAHGWLEIGRTDEWLRRLDEIAALDPAALHPGRGVPGDPRLLDDMRRYLNRVVQLVAAESPTLPGDGDAASEAQHRIIDRIVSEFPERRFAVFLRSGIPAEYARQASLRDADLLPDD